MKFNALVSQLVKRLMNEDALPVAVSVTHKTTSDECLNYCNGGKPGDRFFHRRLTKTLVVMKLTILFIAVACLQVCAKGFSQNITYSGSNVSLPTVFSVIEKQTGYNIVYNPDWLIKAKPVSVVARDLPVDAFLVLALKGQPFDFSIENTTVILSRVQPVPAGQRPVHAESTDNAKALFTFHGIVRDEDGNVLSAASITDMNTKIGVVSDANGLFSINASQGDIVTVTYIGFEKVKVKINSETSVVVVFSERPNAFSGSDDINPSAGSVANGLRTGQMVGSGPAGFILTLVKVGASLQDVIVNRGYGVSKRKDLLATVSKVTGKDIQKMPLSNVLATLQGMVPGLDVANSSGTPGASVQVRLRGINTMNDVSTSVAALVLVDGVPVSDFSYLSPSDIESVEVLKDASATAIYGSRGAAGVIIISTKRGKMGTGPGRLSFQAYTSLVKPARTAQMLNSSQYRMLRKEGFSNDNIAITTSNAPDLYYDSTISTDWAKTLYQNALTQDYQLNFTGGSKSINYYVSGGYRNEDAIVKGDWYQRRINTRMGMDAKVSDKLTVGGGIGFSNLNGRNYNSAIAATIYYALPLIRADSAGIPNTKAYVSPFANPNRQLNAYSLSSSSQYLGNFYFNYEIIKSLFLRTDISYQQTNGQSTQFTPTTAAPYSTTSLSSYPSATYGYNSFGRLTVEPQLNYSVTAKKHRVQLLAGGTLINSISKATTLSMTGFSSNLLPTLATATTYTGKSYSENPYKFASAFGRVSYNYDGKYLAEGVFRRDGSSRFGESRKYGNFWSAAAGWVFSNEPFVKNILGDGFFGKIKASYGIAGSDNISDFGYIGYSSSNVYNSTPATYVSNQANTYLQWEQTSKLDVGLDLTLLQNRLNISVNYFNHRSNNTLFSQALSIVTGFSSVSANLDGLVNNKGVEFMATADLLRTRNFKWITQLNISTLSNKLLALPGLASLSNSIKYQYSVGQPLAINWGFRFQGIDSATGNAKFEDKDGSGTIASFTADQQVLGKSIPDFFGGWTNAFIYKQFELNVFTQFVSGIQKSYTTYTSFIGDSYNLPVDALRRWRAKGDMTDVPRAAAPGTAAAINNAKISSSSYVFSDASYLRIKNITLGYTFQGLAKYKISNLRLFVTGYNLFTITGYKGNDPESGPSLVPVTKSYTVGLNLSL